MKKLIAVCFVACFVFASCDKDETTSEKFSTQTVEQNKAIVEESGVQFVQSMNRMESLQSIDVMMSFGNLGIPGSKGTVQNIPTMDAILNVAKGNATIGNVFSAMSSPDPQILWQGVLGTYTWSKILHQWIFVAGGTKAIFLFPSSESALTNDATLTLSNFTSTTITDPMDPDLPSKFPASLNIELKKGDNALMSYAFSATYNANGIPSMIASDLTLETFKWEVDLTNNSSEVSVNYKLSESSKVVLDLGMGGKGNFTVENYDANTKTMSETYTYTDYEYNPITQDWDEHEVTATDTWEETEFEEIINSANAHFQLFNVVLRGDINIKAFMDQMRTLDANETIQEDAYFKAMADEINKNLNLRLVNAANNEIMAKAEAYVTHQVYNWGDDYDVDFRLTFGDGSLADVETYFNQGFADFITAVNDLISDINTDFGANLEPVGK
ncbi:MAG TPA: hypothetical protein VHO50_08720 [Bacteroidales bacterium]|nr:hypothetical protein [Bacteroidales bacterium]